MAARKKAQGTKVLSTDWPRELDQAMKRVLKDPGIVKFLEHGPEDLAFRQIMLLKLFNKRLDRRVRALVRKLIKEKKR